MYFLLFDKWKLLTYMATLVVVATTAQLHSKKCWRFVRMVR